MNKKAFRPYDDMEYMKMGRENLPNPIQVNGPAIGVTQARERAFQVTSTVVHIILMTISFNFCKNFGTFYN